MISSIVSPFLAFTQGAAPAASPVVGPRPDTGAGPTAVDGLSASVPREELSLLPPGLSAADVTDEAPRSSFSRLAIKALGVAMMAGTAVAGVVGNAVAGPAQQASSSVSVSLPASSPAQAQKSVVVQKPASPSAGAQAVSSVANPAQYGGYLIAPGSASRATVVPQGQQDWQDQVYQHLQQHTLAPTPVKAETVQKTYPEIKVHKGDYVSHHVNYSTLITNEEFTDANAMSVTQLQSFFEGNGSFLATFQQDGKTAAQIIDQAAKAHKINPRVILATLEKENGLVSRTTQPQKWVLKSAMGYAYNDAGGSAGRQSTFAFQIDKGAELLHDLYEEGQQVNFPAKMVVDYGTRRLQVNNAATWSLMRYTPHTRDIHLDQIGGGNHLFHNVMDRLVRMTSEVKA